jgi:uncharacterized protein (UPF0335 family)
MNQKLTQSQLAQVVAEVERLSQQREAELDREQVKEILQELQLPDDLLDEALVQIKRREALAKEQKRNLAIGVVVGVALVGGISSSIIWMNQRKEAIANKMANISVSQSRITLAKDSGDNFTVFDRQQSPQLYYRVTLQNAPQGEKLSLGCDWIDSTGQVVHQNRYQTKTINQDIWPTYCRYQLGTAAEAGTWQVEMTMGDRLLSQTEFTVK